jgi:hypothetical protein
MLTTRVMGMLPKTLDLNRLSEIHQATGVTWLVHVACKGEI